MDHDDERPHKNDVVLFRIWSLSRTFVRREAKECNRGFLSASPKADLSRTLRDV